MTSTFAPATLAHLRTRLEHRRGTAAQMINVCRADADTALHDLDISDLLDSDTPDGGSNVLERARALNLARAAADTAAAADAALHRLAAGHYGFCEGCGDRIPLARLHALPETTSCICCKLAAGRVLAAGGVTR